MSGIARKGSRIHAAMIVAVGVGLVSPAAAPAVEWMTVPGSDVQPTEPACDHRISRFEVRNDRFAVLRSDALAHRNHDSTNQSVTASSGRSPLTIEMAIVAGDDLQPEGPTHAYRIGVYEITNAEFQAFLNDAHVKKTDPEGQWVFHDTDSGDVYIHPEQTGAEGTNGSGTLLFDASDGGRIEFDGAQYRIALGTENEPVVGVSWFGAVKFCNWLTVCQGMNAAQRVYTEGASPGDWHPVTISASDWAFRDLSDAERAELISLAGYRLPMDGGTGEAGRYNEWYKAAAWSHDTPAVRLTASTEGSAPDGEAPGDAVPEPRDPWRTSPPGEVGANVRYGFGRDDLAGADANYWASGDPYDNWVTPVGWFDGAHFLGDGTTRTRETANGFGLFDLCGNVGEWVQDQGDPASHRATRGGSWADVEQSSLLENTGRGSDEPSSTRAFTGFRVAQAQPPASIRVTPGSDLTASGPVGGAYDPEGTAFHFTLSTDATAWANEYAVSTDAEWVTLNANGQTAAGLVEPGQEVDIEVSFNGETDALGATAAPIIEMATVRAGEGQPGGPAYSFRIAVYETTNKQFVEFLNDAVAAPTSPRGHYLYVDTTLGDVYINDAEAGGKGVGPGPRTTLMFEAGANQYVWFDEITAKYGVAAGFELHPVVGVSWFGGLKYCNWLSLRDGLGESQRAYTEGPNAGDWHAVTISTCDWWGTNDTAGNPTAVAVARDLTDAERADLVTRCVGYRLPMDGGATSASPYNEWYKGAAWNGSANDLYGFGPVEGPLTGAYANFRCSGDPHEDGADCLIGGTTPVGFFDGGNLLGDGATFTVDTQNRFSLYDMTGNAAEWVQGVGEVASDRATRGGHWGHDAASFHLTAEGRDPYPAGTTSAYVGFRVVQSNLDHVAELAFADVTTGEVFTRHVRLLLTEPLSVDPSGGFDASGMFGGPFTPEVKRYTLASSSITPMSWEVTVSQDGPRWLDLNDGASDGGEFTVGTDVTVDVTINGTALTQLPGEYQATVRFANATTGYAETREFTLAVLDPLAVTPGNWEVASVSGVPLVPAAATIYEMTNLSSADLSYAVTTGATWITLADGAAANGTIAPYEDPEDVVTVTATTNDNIAALSVGEYRETITFHNYTVGSARTREVHLAVTDALLIAPAALEGVPDFEWRGDFGGPFTPSTDPEEPAYTVENIGVRPVYYVVSVDGADWLDIAGGSSFSGNLAPGASAQVPLALNDRADVLAPGQYPAELQFEDYASGYTQTRRVVLAVAGDLAVTPVTDFQSSGREGGPFAPRSTAYTLGNVGGSGPLSWTVSSDPPVAWVLIEGQPDACGVLVDDESVEVHVSIDSLAAADLGAGAYAAVLKFAGGGAVPVTRRVSLTVVVPGLAVDEQWVPATPTPLNGPAYAYAVATYPTTNAEFAAFLNDALLNLSGDRGQYMYFDTDTGDVYINDKQLGEEGPAAPSHDRTTLMYDASIGRIQLAGDYYAVDAGWEIHPIVGVSWYGAIKYCNWLTLDQGMQPEQRCYTEAAAPNLDGWHPVTISTTAWAERGLNRTEQSVLALRYRGYRLPMDDGADNTDPAVDQTDAYNEWYKAAAFNGTGGHWAFGFGRNELNEFDGADANYATDGAPFISTTPAGFYGVDGARSRDDPVFGWSDPLVATFTVQDTDNYYGLHDMTGNVFQWMQGWFSPASPGRRAVRGGSWAVPSEALALRATHRTFADAVFANEQIGFRVIRSLPAAGDADDDGDVDGTDFLGAGTCLTGPIPGIGLPSGCDVFDLDRDDDFDLGDFAQFQNVFSGAP